MENLKDKKTDDILEKLVHVNRITKVVKGGRRFGFSALVVVGNQNGKIGVAHAKAKQVPDAIKKANDLARRNLIQVPLREGRTIHHDELFYLLLKVFELVFFLPSHLLF